MPNLLPRQIVESSLPPLRSSEEYFIQPEGEYWLCIPDAIKEEILEIVHGEGHLGFHRALQKMRRFVVHKGAKKSFASIPINATSAERMQSRDINPMDRYNRYWPHRYHFIR